MSAEENKALFLRFFDDVWAGRPPFDDAWIKEILVAFPDLKATPDRVLAAEDDHVLILFTVTATQLGAYRGIPATGEPISFRGSTTARLEDGQIVEEFPFMEKMGAVMIGQMLGQTAESSWKVGKETQSVSDGEQSADISLLRRAMEQEELRRDRRVAGPELGHGTEPTRAVA